MTILHVYGNAKIGALLRLEEASLEGLEIRLGIPRVEDATTINIYLGISMRNIVICTSWIRLKTLADQVLNDELQTYVGKHISEGIMILENKPTVIEDFIAQITPWLGVSESEPKTLQPLDPGMEGSRKDLESFPCIICQKEGGNIYHE